MKRPFLFFIYAVISISVFSQGAITPTFVDSIPMRDGKKIAVDIYIPDGGSGNQYSCVLVQTPYNRQAYQIIGLPLVGNDIAGSPFAFVIADWRGFFGSYAAIVAGYDKGKDGYDMVEWIALRTWSNGRIGTWGPSALGNIQFMTAKKRPPHLICSVPLVASGQFKYQEYYPGGVYRTEYLEQLDALGFGVSLIVKPYPTYDNVWQYFIEPAMYYPDSIDVPMFMIGGWYDHGTVTNLEMFNGLRNESYADVRNLHRLMMGPWAHGGMGPAHVKPKAGVTLWPCSSLVIIWTVLQTGGILPL
jgi:predicted acyl esterase